MINFESAEPEFYIMYHAKCLDGFTAAFVLHQALAVDLNQIVHLLPCSYGRAPEVLEEDSHIIIVDFSFEPAVMEEMVQRYKSVIILDHHKTAIEKLNAYDWSVGILDWSDTMHMSETPLEQYLQQIEDEPDTPVLHQWLDMEYSGAGLAFMFIEGHTSFSDLVKHVQDRDLWKFEYASTKPFCEALATREMSISSWKTISRTTLITEGVAIMRYKEALIDSMLPYVRLIHIEGYGSIWGIECPGKLASDVGNAIVNEQGLAVTYYDTPTHRHYSLRSNKEIDVSEIAEIHGGGGHVGAAGFIVPLRDHW